MNERLIPSEAVQSVEYMDLPGWAPARTWHPGLEPMSCRATNQSPARSGRGTFARILGLLMLAVVMLAAPAASNAQLAVGISVSFGPPALPVYYQPPCPGYGYIWTPGFWAWDPDFGYYWVPGTWVNAPFQGALWTPGYWGWDDDGDSYVWHEGYWGPVVGFYGGVIYGFGYTGYGYEGGYWRGGNYYYNRSVNNIQTTNITYVYNKTVINNVNETRVSYNGGSGGTTARPSSEQMDAARGRRSGPVADQQRQMQVAQSNPQQRANVNKGRPAVAATARPGAFSGGEAVQAKAAGAPYEPPKISPRAATKSAPQGAERSVPGNERTPEAAPTKHEVRPTLEQPQNRGSENPMPGNGRVQESKPSKHEAQPSMEQPQNRGAERSMPGGRAPESKPPKQQDRPMIDQPQNRGAERSMPSGRAPEAAPPQRESAPRSRDVQPNVERQPMERAPNAQPGGQGRGKAPEAGKQQGKPPKPEKDHKPNDE